jgi:nitroreductase
MDIFQTIANRHSYRGVFKDEAVKRDDLTKIVQAGLDAPSGCNAQTTEFVIVDNSELVSKINKMSESNKAVQTAKAYIACIVNKKPEPVYQGKAFEIEDCAAAVENMLLAITALGYASVWIDGWLRAEDRNEIISKMLGVNENKIVRIILPIGIPAEPVVAREKKLFSQRAWFNLYKSN